MCVTQEEALSPFDGDGRSGDHPELVVDDVTDVGDAVVRHEDSSRGENTCETGITYSYYSTLFIYEGLALEEYRRCGCRTGRT